MALITPYTRLVTLQKEVCPKASICLITYHHGLDQTAVESLVAQQASSLPDDHCMC